MAGFTIREWIRAPRAQVFARASDLRNAARTITAIKRVEVLTDGPIGVGTRFRETRVLFKREATEEMTVTAFDPPRGYALGATGCGCEYRTELRFDDKDGGTEVAMTFAARPLTWVARVMSVLMRPLIKMGTRLCARDLADLKAAIEGTPRSGSAGHLAADDAGSQPSS